MKNKPYLTLEKSQELADHLLGLGIGIQLLDADYLRESIRQMRENHLWRDAAAILSPNPQTHFEKQEVNGLKIKQLELFLALRENVDAIQAASANLRVAEKNSNDLSKLFG